jgi:probable rRNA maturation factor
MTPDGGTVPKRGLDAWLASAAPATARGEVTVALVSDGRMRALNRAFRGRDTTTDVLSFPVASTTADSRTDQGGHRRSRVPHQGIADAPPLPRGRDRYLGDIVIATGVARRQAAEAGHALGTELKILALHGLLHLLGYDHEADGGRMARTEERLRRKAGLRTGLIARTTRR